ncbi:unnamed protein product [Polarella glacialis]|uniref:MYND-type domain-containing protein n=1 Tax=Polarella glacialis TaxID=89957 RepID=A0A813JMG8_POLGL|nr:unnamed protein product [Polarella glacialis]
MFRALSSDENLFGAFVGAVSSGRGVMQRAAVELVVAMLEWSDEDHNWPSKLYSSSRLVQGMLSMAQRFPFDFSENSCQANAVIFFSQAIISQHLAEIVRDHGVVERFLTYLEKVAEDVTHIKFVLAWSPVFNFLHRLCCCLVPSVRAAVLSNPAVPSIVGRILWDAGQHVEIPTGHKFPVGHRWIEFAQTLLDQAVGLTEDCKSNLELGMMAIRPYVIDNVIHVNGSSPSKLAATVEAVEDNRCQPGNQLFFGGSPCVALGRCSKPGRLRLRTIDGIIADVALTDVDLVPHATISGFTVPQLSLGRRVCLVGLEKRPELDGTCGNLGAFDGAFDGARVRWAFVAEETLEELSVLPTNLISLCDVEGTSVMDAARSICRFQGVANYVVPTEQHDKFDPDEAFLLWFLDQESADVMSGPQATALSAAKIGCLLRAQHLSRWLLLRPGVTLEMQRSLQEAAFGLRAQVWTAPLQLAWSTIIAYTKAVCPVSRASDIILSSEDDALECVFTRLGILFCKIHAYCVLGKGGKDSATSFHILATARALILPEPPQQATHNMMQSIRWGYIFCGRRLADTSIDLDRRDRLYTDIAQIIKDHSPGGELSVTSFQVTHGLGEVMLLRGDFSAARRAEVTMAVELAKNDNLKRDQFLNILLYKLRGQIALEKGKLGNDKLQFAEAIRHFTDAKTLREEGADGRWNKFGFISGDHELYMSIMGKICQLFTRLHGLGGPASKIHVSTAKKMYGFCAVEYGLEHSSTCLSLHALGVALAIGGDQESTRAVATRSQHLAQMLGEVHVSKECNAFLLSLHHISGPPSKLAGRVVMDVPTKCGNRTCGKVCETCAKFQKCSGCKLVKYCSEQCQLDAYGLHGPNCRRCFPKQKDANTTSAVKQL